MNDLDKEAVRLTQKDAMRIASILSDVQHVLGDNKEERGRLNLVKGVLFGEVVIEEVNPIAFRFRNKHPNSRFCDGCGLLSEGDYAECECKQEKVEAKGLDDFPDPCDDGIIDTRLEE